jgi:hypothetical protein
MSDSNITAAKLANDFDNHIYKKQKNEDNYTKDALENDNQRVLDKLAEVGDKTKFAKLLNSNVQIKPSLNENHPFEEVNKFEFNPDKTQQV